MSGANSKLFNLVSKEISTVYPEYTPLKRRNLIVSLSTDAILYTSPS